MSEILIRPAERADLPLLKDFEQAIIKTERPFNNCLKADHFCYYDIGALIDSSRSTVMVAESDGKIIGSGYARIRDSKAHLVHDQHIYLGFMYVAESVRGQGINQLVINALIAWGQERGFRDFYLEAYAQNAPALSAYKKIGFEPSIVELKLSL
ncbi:GNAT family N-acetyltransferase [Paraglaciecola aquimarina]|uniref:GNAT family N-acetyltransferase n=1 Tax=Paraglaciecola aquimarina TaxID=1235557 RepID=A0ABU3SWX0_9ALTE|nr:GNAT family N-acetyltransferase [Paraglaciecola aquimarina]MDU0354504.1 GNAT family N-acetyltransferase [Paraglaciecola aquimarina]